MQSGVYQIRNTTTGSVYVGSAVHIGRRWKSHRCALRNQGKSPPKLQRAWGKYGEKSFAFEVVEYCHPDDLLAREQVHIDRLQPRYNTRDVAESNYGVRWPDEVNMKKGRIKKTYTVRGVTGNARQLAEHFGVASKDTARWRIYRGWGVEEAFLTPNMDHKARGEASAEKRDNSKRGRHETAFGVRANLKDLHQLFGVVSYTAFKRRVGLGWDIEQALTRPARGAK